MNWRFYTRVTADWWVSPSASESGHQAISLGDPHVVLSAGLCFGLYNFSKEESDNLMPKKYHPGCQHPGGWAVECGLVAGRMKVKCQSLSRVWLFVIPWTAACQASPSMEFSRQEYTGEGSHSLLQGIFPTQGSNPGLLHCRQILRLPLAPPSFRVELCPSLGCARYPTSRPSLMTSPESKVPNLYLLVWRRGQGA